MLSKIIGKLFDKETKPSEHNFDPDDLPKSEEELLNDAELGNPVSAYRVAYKYLSDDSSSTDVETAAMLLISSSSKGYTPALKLLGNCYFNGKGVNPSRIIASALYELAKDPVARKMAIGQSPAMHSSVSGHFYRKLKKSKSFADDLIRFAAEVGLYEQDQFVKQGKDPQEQAFLMLSFTSPEALDSFGSYD